MDEATVKSLIKDLDKLADTIREVQEMCKVEKKEQRKLAEIMDKVSKPGHCWSFPELAGYAIDAVIECYEEWKVDFSSDPKKTGAFPEYLKEKLA